MIKHYILLSAEFLPNGEDTTMKIDFDHGLLLSTFGGVAYDTDAKTWVSPSQLSSEDAEEDSIFLNFISQVITGSEPD